MGLPQMLGISVALHFAIGLVVILANLHLYGRGAAFSPESVPSTSLIFTVRSKSAPDRQALLSDNLRPESGENSSPTASDPLSPFPEIPKPQPPAPAVALKSSTMSHVRFPAESVLAPASPPHVNSREGTVFVLDVSGSMYEPFAGSTRLAFARQVLAQRIRALPEGTPFAIVLYGESALRSGPLVTAGDATRQAAIAFINGEHDLGGGTDLPRGLISASELHMGSLLLVTDGDLNANSDDLIPKVRDILNGEASLAVIGIAPRAKTDANEILQDLADQDNGTYQVGKEGDPTDLLTTDRPDTAPH